jgi:CRP/FNR family cyclic AMP-dependent transcriptional regulator
MSKESQAYYLSRLKKAVIFRFLEDDLLTELLDIAKLLKYKTDDVIISEGELSPYLFAVLEGEVNVTVKETGGEEVFICAIDEGDVFGEAGIFIKARRTASVVSAANTTLLRVHRKDLLGFIRAHPSAGIKILMILIYNLLKKLRDANQEIAFERKSNLNQEDIDAITGDLLRDDES